MDDLLFYVQQLINRGSNMSDVGNLLFCVQQLINSGSNMSDVDNKWATFSSVCSN